MESGIGYRFHPTEDELINYYLRLKMLGHDDQVGMIPEINMLKVEPWDIPEKAMMMPNNSNDQVWYFFWAPNYKYANSQRVDRKTKAGYWKVTGKDREVREIAIKKTLVFYKGHGSKAVKTNWILHQYNANFDFEVKKEFFMCKLKKNLDVEDSAILDQEGDEINTTTDYTENQILYENNYVSTHGGGGFDHQVPSSSGNYATEDDFQMQAYVQSFQGHNEMDYNLNSALPWPNYNNYYG